MANEINKDGLAVHYGVRVAENAIAGSYETDGVVNELVVDMDYSVTALTAATTILGETAANLALRTDAGFVPAGAKVLDIVVATGTAFNLTTTARLVTLAAPTTAVGSVAMAAANTSASAAGGTVNAAALYVDVFHATGTPTAGTGRVTIRYV